MASEDVVAWDEEEKFSEWAWLDQNFAEQQDLLDTCPSLCDVKKIIEDKGDL